MNHLTRNPISVGSLLAEVQSTERGGTCIFLGTVRTDDDVTGIEYSAYDDMALAEIERMLTEARDQWPDARVTLQHRIGMVAAGDASIAIAAAAPHREAAFGACRYVIEEVKKRLPVWKMELHLDGTTTWVDPSGKPVPHPLTPSPHRGEGDRTGF
jgi:molybdopterin synthase catalytic subunit